MTVAAKSAARVWSPDWIVYTHALYAAGTHLPAVYGDCVWDTLGCAGYVHDPHRLTNPNTVASHRLVMMAAAIGTPIERRTMKAWNPLTPDRYRPLESNLTDTKPLIIDTNANPQDILECAVQRLRASADLLRTLY